jgi:hypothetical protein
MGTHLKTIGAGALAALAMSAAMASAAHAAEFTAEKYPAVITGHVEKIVLEAGGGILESTTGTTVRCAEETEEGTLAMKSRFLLSTIHKGQCTSSLGFTASYALNGCDFTFEAGEATSEEEAHGTMGIVCPAGKSITVTAGTCVIHIPAQVGLTGIKFTNKPGDAKTPKPWTTVDVDVNDQIRYVETDGFLCPFSSSGEGSNGDFETLIEMKAYEDKGNQAHPTTANKVQYKEGAAVGMHVK